MPSGRPAVCTTKLAPLARASSIHVSTSRHRSGWLSICVRQNVMRSTVSTATAARDGAPDGQQLVVVGEGAGDCAAVLCGVRGQAVRRETKRAGAYGIF